MVNSSNNNSYILNIFANDATENNNNHKTFTGSTSRGFYTTALHNFGSRRHILLAIGSSRERYSSGGIVEPIVLVTNNIFSDSFIAKGINIGSSTNFNCGTYYNSIRNIAYFSEGLYGVSVTYSNHINSSRSHGVGFSLIKVNDDGTYMITQNKPINHLQISSNTYDSNYKDIGIFPIGNNKCGCLFYNHQYFNSNNTRNETVSIRMIVYDINGVELVNRVDKGIIFTTGIGGFCHLSSINKNTIEIYVKTGTENVYPGSDDYYEIFDKRHIYFDDNGNVTGINTIGTFRYVTNGDNSDYAHSGNALTSQGVFTRAIVPVDSKDYLIAGNNYIERVCNIGDKYAVGPYTSSIFANSSYRNGAIIGDQAFNNMCAVCTYDGGLLVKAIRYPEKLIPRVIPIEMEPNTIYTNRGINVYKMKANQKIEGLCSKLCTETSLGLVSVPV